MRPTRAATLQVLGVSIRLGSFFPLVVSLSALLSGVVMPVVGALADRTQWKRELLALFAYLGAIATMGLYFLQGDRFLLGGILLVVANVAYAVSLVVYFRRSPGQMSETRCPPAAGR